jgi:hypothetical protein
MFNRGNFLSTFAVKSAEWVDVICVAHIVGRGFYIEWSRDPLRRSSQRFAGAVRCALAAVSTLAPFPANTGNILCLPDPPVPPSS